MKTTIDIDKNDYPSPGEVGALAERLSSIPNDNVVEAVHKLRQFRELLMHIYVTEMNDPAMDRRAVRELKEGEDYQVTDWPVDANGSPAHD
jgi:hypothetical protein